MLKGKLVLEVFDTAGNVVHHEEHTHESGDVPYPLILDRFETDPSLHKIVMAVNKL